MYGRAEWPAWATEPTQEHPLLSHTRKLTPGDVDALGEPEPTHPTPAGGVCPVCSQPYPNAMRPGDDPRCWTCSLDDTLPGGVNHA